MFAFQSCGYFNAKQDICNKDVGLEYLNYIKGKVEFCFVLRIFWKYHKNSQKWIKTNLILLFILICINAKRFISFSATQLQNCPCLRKQKNISSQLINSLNSLHNPSCLKWATVFFFCLTLMTEKFLCRCDGISHRIFQACQVQLPVLFKTDQVTKGNHYITRSTW